MEAVAHARYQRFGPRKVAQVLGLIRGKSVKSAQDLLPHVAKRASVVVGKTLKSAAANLAVKAGRALGPEEMVVKAAWATQGPMQQLKRVQPGPQGRALPFKRKMCHLTIVVAESGGN
jgi:large subunit ribosomal protein L22